MLGWVRDIRTIQLLSEHLEDEGVENDVGRTLIGIAPHTYQLQIGDPDTIFPFTNLGPPQVGNDFVLWLPGTTKALMDRGRRGFGSGSRGGDLPFGIPGYDPVSISLLVMAGVMASILASKDKWRKRKHV